MRKFGGIEFKQSHEDSKFIEHYRRVVFPLAAAETLVWTAYFYSFPAFLTILERDQGFYKANFNGRVKTIVCHFSTSISINRQADKSRIRSICFG